jgi:hypothetical protein
MKRAICISSLLILLICTFPFLSIAQTDEFGQWASGISKEPYQLIFKLYSKQDATAFQKKWEMAREENNGLSDNEWAGDYADDPVGDVAMIVLRWSPKSGFAFASLHNCDPMLVGLNYGNAVLSSEWLELFPEASIQPKHHDNPHAAHSRKLPAKRFIPARWGELHYLIPENGVADFYNYVAGLGRFQLNDNPGWGYRDFLIKMEDYDKTPKGMPVLPPGHESFVKRPIEANITAVGNIVKKKQRWDDGSIYYDSITPVMLDRGKASGVKKGMRFYIVGSKEREQVEIISAGSRSSKGIIERTLDEDLRATFKDWNTAITRLYPEIRAGWRATTSYPLSEQN